MARGVIRGDLWLCEFRRPDKRRPVLVLSRQAAIEALHTVIIAPVTTTIRGMRSEVPLGVEHGLKTPSAANLDHVQIVERSKLTRYLGNIGPERMARACLALAVATGCAD